MNPLAPSKCHACGYKGESRFEIAGPHIKQRCGGCGRYIKFASKTDMPAVEEIGLRIWQAMGGRTQENEAKVARMWLDMGGKYIHTGKLLFVKTWELYLKIKEEYDEDS